MLIRLNIRIFLWFFFVDTPDPLFSSWGLDFIKDMAKTGFMVKATSIEAVRAMIMVMGRNDINFPGSPGVKIKGKKGAMVVRVPVNTAMATSPTPLLAAGPIARSAVVVK